MEIKNLKIILIFKRMHILDCTMSNNNIWNKKFKAIFRQRFLPGVNFTLILSTFLNL